MIIPVVAPTPVSAPSQFVSKVDKADRRRLKVGVDAYVHGNEESDTSNQAVVYDRHGNKQRMSTQR